MRLVKENEGSSILAPRAPHPAGDCINEALDPIIMAILWLPCLRIHMFRGKDGTTIFLHQLLAGPNHASIQLEKLIVCRCQGAWQCNGQRSYGVKERQCSARKFTLIMQWCIFFSFCNTSGSIYCKFATTFFFHCDFW